jgi:hypothetical protein
LNLPEKLDPGFTDEQDGGVLLIRPDF